MRQRPKQIGPEPRLGRNGFGRLMVVRSTWNGEEMTGYRGFGPDLSKWACGLVRR